MIQASRVHALNTHTLGKTGDYIMYWMQAAQRTEYNHALEYAIRLANEQGLPVLVYFELIDNYPEANMRHYAFMLRGMVEVADALKQRNISFVCHYDHPKYKSDNFITLAKHARSVITDVGYTRFQRDWRTRYAKEVLCPMFAIETNIVVPVEIASTKEEYAARTIRPKIHKKLAEFLVPLRHTRAKYTLSSVPRSVNVSQIERLLALLRVDRSVTEVRDIIPGTKAAKTQLKDFLQNKLSAYAQKRNDPSEQYLSGMSPYLHFGQISPLYIALQAQKKKTKDIDVFLEELIVRRELAINFVYYNKQYDSYESIPDWAQQSLKKHAKDKREFVYTKQEFEQAKTHDPYWNAAQLEMVYTGKMHGYMRMYWGKKILEWSKSPKEAFQIALYLNDKYELDGRDPNGYTGVAWCFGKHDRPWFERDIFGTVRYMNANGLKRKFDIEEYVRQVSLLSTS